MKDSHYHTKETLAAQIREIRVMKEIMTDEEARLVMLHEAADQHGCMVDSRGNPIKPGRKKRILLGDVPEHVKKALRNGSYAGIPAYRD